MDAPTPKTAAHDLRSHHVRVGEMEWKPTRFPGCEVKTLLFDREALLERAGAAGIAIVGSTRGY